MFWHLRNTQIDFGIKLFLFLLIVISTFIRRTARSTFFFFLRPAPSSQFFPTRQLLQAISNVHWEIPVASTIGQFSRQRRVSFKERRTQWLIRLIGLN